MRIKSVEVISLEAATNLRAQARRERREKRKRFENMTGRDVRKLHEVVLSRFQARAALQLSVPPATSPLLPIVNDQVGKFEDSETIGLFSFARGNGWKPVAVEFFGDPSKAFVDSLRQAAKVRKLTAHFYQLIEGWAILEVRPQGTPEEADANFLKRLGVQW